MLLKTSLIAIFFIVNSTTYANNNKLEIYPEVSGKIIFIAKEESYVNKGEILVSLDSRIAQEKLNKELNILKIKQQQLVDKELDLKNIKTLFDSLVQSKRELELAKIAYKNAKYAYQAQNNLLSLAKLELEKYTIRTPFNAKVIQTPNLRNVTNTNSPLLIMIIEKTK